MHRLVRLPLATLAAAALVVTPVLAGTSAAAPAKGGPGHAAAAPGKQAGRPASKPAEPAGKPAHAKPAGKPGPQAGPRGVEAKVVVVGVVTATSTVTTGGTGGTSTVLVTVRVQGGDREYRGRSVQVAVDAKTVVKRDHGKRVRYELRVGDKVTVHARRAAGGALTATYVAASGRPHVVPAAPPATPTATTTR